jgi:formate dehydrogenase subunit gamma
MAATTPRPEGSVLRRFDRIERALHWVNAALFAVLVATGAALYLGPIGAIIGRRALVEDVHVYTGVALPVPLLLAVAGPWGRFLRTDLQRFNRWTRDDRSWLRAAFSARALREQRWSEIRVGKFNSGQKLNAAFVAGAGLVMLGTGLIMRWYHPWPLAWRTGATFVHDWLSLGLGLVILGHVLMALRDPDALRSMVTGRISRQWARRHAPAWEDGSDQPTAAPAPRIGRYRPRAGRS